jgi:hypothetical protein
VTTQMSAKTVPAVVDSSVETAAEEPDVAGAGEVTRVHSGQGDRRVSLGRVLAYRILHVSGGFVSSGSPKCRAPIAGLCSSR